MNYTLNKIDAAPFRVLHIGLTSNRGGVESFVMSLYRQIDRTRIQFDFLVDHDKQLPFESEIVELGGNVYYDYYNLTDRKQGNSVSDFFAMHPEINAVHLNANGLNTYFRVLQVAKKRGIQTRILHSHNNGYMFQYNWKQKLYEKYVRLNMKNVVTHYFACSDQAAVWMFGKKTPYRILPNSIDLKKFAFNEVVRTQFRKELGIADDEILLGFVGSFNYQKDPAFLIDILEQCKCRDLKYKLLMLGQGTLFQEIQEKIKMMSLEKHVICVGNQHNVHEYMQAMDLFVLPSHFEGFGIVLIEAQAAGLKCITSKDVVPESTNVTGNVTYLSKNEGATYWAEYICSMNKERFDGQEQLMNSDYDIKRLAVMMEEIYLNGQ